MGAVAGGTLCIQFSGGKRGGWSEVREGGVFNWWLVRGRKEEGWQWRTQRGPPGSRIRAHTLEEGAFSW